MKESAFVTSDGLYEYNVLSFGLCNAPSTFQRLIDKVLGSLKWKIALVYIEDTVIFSKTFDNHLVDLRLVLEASDSRRRYSQDFPSFHQAGLNDDRTQALKVVEREVNWMLIQISFSHCNTLHRIIPCPCQNPRKKREKLLDFERERDRILLLTQTLDVAHPRVKHEFIKCTKCECCQNMLHILFGVC